MIRNFQQLQRMAAERKQRSGEKPVVSVANAADREVIAAVKALRDSGMADAILTGRRDEIEDLCLREGLEPLPEIVEAEGEAEAAAAAAALVAGGRAHVLMKGLVNSNVFLKALLNPQQGLRGAGLLCHLAAFEVPGWPKLQFHTDGGMNLFPDLEQKRRILELAVEALHRLGVDEPRVAVLSANEVVNPKVPSSVEAAQLAAWNAEGRIGGCIVEGPMAMDVALSAEAAAHKHIESRIAGDADLFLVPNIEAGNMVGKTLMYCAHAKMAGVILGAACPVVMVSRADNAEAKLNSLALALVLACRRQAAEDVV